MNVEDLVLDLYLYITAIYTTARARLDALARRTGGRGFSRTLPNKAGIPVELCDKSDDIKLHVLFSETGEKLFLFVETISILAMCNDYQRTSLPIVLIAFLVLCYVFTARYTPSITAV